MPKKYLKQTYKMVKHTKAAEAARRFYRKHRASILRHARAVRRRAGAKKGSKAEHYRV